jgi:hypothetical protein
LLSAALGTIVLGAWQQNVKAEAVDICRLQADPSAYNRRLIEVSGIVRHGFEEFSLSDSNCLRDFGIWLEYGGSVNADTVFCCGTRAGAPRGGTLVVEGLTLPLVDGALFRRFDDHIRKGRASNDVTFSAKLRGHFFAGKKQPTPDGREYWGGYGHLGCCSLLVIQQVLAVDDNRAVPPRIHGNNNCYCCPR